MFLLGELLKNEMKFTFQVRLLSKVD